MCDLPLCRQFLCTHCNLRTCYRRAEKRCWVRDSCKPRGYTSPRLLPSRLPCNPRSTLSFTHVLPPYAFSLHCVSSPFCPSTFDVRLHADFSYHFSTIPFFWLTLSVRILSLRFHSVLAFAWVLSPFPLSLSLSILLLSLLVFCVFLHWYFFVLRLLKCRGRVRI